MPIDPSQQHIKKTDTISRSYLGNTSKGTTGGSSSHRSRDSRPSWTVSGRGGRAMAPTRPDMPGLTSNCNDTPNWPTETQHRLEQQQPQYARNQHRHGGGHPKPPASAYYMEGYHGPINYPTKGRFMPPPYGPPPIGWGGPNPFQQDRPSGEAMDIDDASITDSRTMAPLPRRRSPHRQEP
jgi:hypothetical protein